MTLNFRDIPIDMTNGIRRKQDDVLSTSLRRLENGRFSDGGVIETRPGYTVNDLGDGERMFSHKNRRYLETGESVVQTATSRPILPNLTDYGASAPDTIQLWYRRAINTPVIMPGAPFDPTYTYQEAFGFDSRISVDQTHEMFAVSDGASLRYLVREISTGNVKLSGELRANSGDTFTRPRIVASNSGYSFVLYVLYSDGVFNYLYRYPITDAYATSPGGLVVNFAGGTPEFDADSSDVGTIFLAWWVAGTTTLNFLGTNANGSIGSPISHVTAAGVTKVVVAALDSNAINVCWLETSSTVLKTISYTWPFTSYAEQTVHTYARAVTQLTVVKESTSRANVFVTYPEAASPDNNEYRIEIWQAVDPSSGVADQHLTVAEGCLLLARPIVNDSRYILPVAVAVDPVDPNNGTPITGLLLDVSETIEEGGVTVSGISDPVPVQPVVVARFIIDEAVLPITPRLPGSYVGASSEWYVPYERRSGGGQTTRVLERLEVVAAPLKDAEAQSVTYLAGGCPHIFDGLEIVEEGFNHPPSFLAATSANSADPNAACVPTAVHSLVAVYEWTDAAGNLHQSAPSDPITVTIGAAPHDSIDVEVSTLRITRKANVKIVVYRTANAPGSIYHRELVFDNLRYDSHSVTGTCLWSDEFLEGEPILYTTGTGADETALPNEPMEACRAIVVHQDRLFSVNERDISYTKSFAPRFGVEAVPSLFRFRPPDTWGRVSSLASQDDRLLIACERGLGVLYGQGPDDLGLQNGYQAPQLVAPDFWVPFGQANCLVQGDEGLWAYTRNGLRCLGRGYQVISGPMGPLGSEVDPLATDRGDVTAIRSGRRLYFLFDDADVALVWDRDFQQWSTYTNFQAQSAYASSEAYDTIEFSDGGTIKTHSSAVNLDDGNYIPFLLETAWFKFAGIQGFQRVSRVMFLARGSTGTTIATVDLGVNYTSAYDDSLTTICLDGDEPWQFEHQPVVQKCESMRVKITMTSPGIFKLQNVTLKVGLKQGRFRLPNSGKV